MEPWHGGYGSGKQDTSRRGTPRETQTEGARTPTHGQGLGVAALVHQLVAVLDQGLQLGLIAGHPQESGQLFHHRHQVLEDKSRERGSPSEGAPVPK